MFRFANNFSTRLATSVTPTDTSIVVLDASALPVVSVDNPIYITLQTVTLLSLEIVLCTNVSGNTLTVVRGQEGTTAVPFSSGAYVEGRLVAGVCEAFPQTQGAPDEYAIPYFDSAENSIAPSTIYRINPLTASIRVVLNPAFGWEILQDGTIQGYGTYAGRSMVRFNHTDQRFEINAPIQIAAGNSMAFLGSGDKITMAGGFAPVSALDLVNKGYTDDLVATGLAGKADTVHTHVKANITDFNDADYASAAQGVKADTALQNISSRSMTELVDVPDSLVGQADRAVVVNPAEDGFAYGPIPLTGVAWGDITGVLSAQNDLQAALDGKLNTTGGALTGDLTMDGASDIILGGQALTLQLENKQPRENGFENRTDSVITFTDITRTLQIAPAVTDFTFYSGGNRFTKSAADSFVITNAEGIWLFYYDTSGVLQGTQTFTDEIITLYAFVSAIYWDVANQTAIIVAEERHGFIMDSVTHLYNHNTFGTRYGDGAQVGDLTPDGSGDLPIHAQFSVSGGTIWDEDIKLALAAQAFPANVPIFYRENLSGDWRRVLGSTYLCTTAGSGRGAYNNIDAGGAGVWGLTEVSSGDYFCMHLYATGDFTQPYILITGQVEYTSATNAREGALSELFGLVKAGLPFVEFKEIATFILQTSNTYSNAVQSRLRTTDAGDGYIDWRTVETGTAFSIGSAMTQSAAQTPYDNINSTLAAGNVKLALDELDANKAPTVHTHIKADITDFNDADYATAAQGIKADTALQDITGQNLQALANVPAVLTGEAGKSILVNGTEDGFVYGFTSWGSIAGSLSAQTDLQNALNGKAPTVHTHIKADITDFNDADYATAAQGALAATALQDITGQNLQTLANVPDSLVGLAGRVIAINITENGFEYVALTPPTWGAIVGTLSAQTDLQTALDGKAPTVHTHVKANITDFSDADYATAAQGLLANTALQDITSEALQTLANVPSSLLGQAGKLVKVNPTEDGFIYGDPAGTTVSWGDVAGTLSNQTDLQNELNGKAALVHTHVKADITDFSDADYATAAQGALAATALQDITGQNLQTIANIPTSLAGQAGRFIAVNIAEAGFEYAIPTVGWGAVTGTLSAQTDLQNALNGKAPTVHTHIKADITDFNDADYATAAQGIKADTALQDITGQNLQALANVPAVLTGEAGKSILVNGTEDGFVYGFTSWGSIAGSLSAQTDLQNALNGKAPTVHTHIKADITDFNDADYATAAQGALAATALQDITGQNLQTLANVPDSLVGLAGRVIAINSTEDGFEYAVGAGAGAAWGAITGTISDQVDLQGELDPRATSTGFVGLGIEEASFTFTLGTFAGNFIVSPPTLDPPNDKFLYVRNGPAFTVASPVSSSLSTGQTRKFLFVFSDAGNIQTNNITDDNIRESYYVSTAPIATIYFNKIQDKIIHVGDETKRYEVPSVLQHYLTITKGAEYITGMSPTFNVVDGTASLDNEAALALSAGSFIKPGSFTFQLSATSTTSPIEFLYLLGSTDDTVNFGWASKDANNYVVYNDSAGQNAAYNIKSSGLWGLAPAPDNSIILMHLIALSGKPPKYYWILGRNVYADPDAARAGALNEVLECLGKDLGINPVTPVPPDIAPLPVFTIMVETASTYTNTPKARIRTSTSGSPNSFIDWRGMDMRPGLRSFYSG